MAQMLPPWLEAFILGTLKRYITPEIARAAFLEMKAKVGVWLRAEVAKSATTWDDVVVDKVLAALDSCDPTADLLCQLIATGERGLVDVLRGVAAKSPTLIDDAAVDLLAAALSV